MLPTTDELIYRCFKDNLDNAEDEGLEVEFFCSFCEGIQNKLKQNKLKADEALKQALFEWDL